MPGDRAGGFTLFEVLVAFAIAALALALLYRGGIEGLVTTRTALRRDEAVARATARLEAMCHGARLAAGIQTGDDGSGFSWRTQVQVAESTTLQPGTAEDSHPPLHLTLFSVGVTISWPGGLRPHEVSLQTRCLAAVPG
jgi:general secretion pathway protein I